MIDKEQFFTQTRSLEWEELGAGIRRKIVAYGDSAMAVVVEFEKGSVGALHHHPHIQISTVFSGTFEVLIADKKQILTAGDFFYVPSGSVHGVTALEQGMLVDFFHPMREDFLSRK